MANKDSVARLVAEFYDGTAEKDWPMWAVEAVAALERPPAPSGVLDVCIAIRTLRASELKEMETMAREQAEFVHPLKNATAAKQRALGEYNLKILGMLRNLQAEIKRGPRKETA